LSASTESDGDRRRRAIELLEANHSFPCAFSISVIARNDEAVSSAVVAAVAEIGPIADDGHERRESGGGKYVSHRLLVHCGNPEAVLALFARVREVDGVITVL
jgi:putative lipoic acid-binding regulatory protein